MLDRKPHSSSSGMGLLEVVVASGILVVIALGISNVIVNGQNGAQSVQKHLDSGQLQSFISQILNTPELCTASLVGQNPPTAGASVPTLSFATIKIDDSTNSLFNNGQIKIASLKYKGAPTISGNVYAAIVELQVSLQGSATAAVVGGNLGPPVDFPLVANISAGKISACGGTQGGIAKAWANVYCSVPNVCSLQSSFNVSSFSAVGGIYSVTFQSALPSANYAVLVTANNQHQDSSNNVAGGVMSQTTAGVQFYTFARDDGHFNNSSLVSVVVIQ